MTDKRLIDAMEVERVFNQWLGEADSLAEQEAVEAVRDYFLAIRETDGVDSMEYKWMTGDGSEVTLTLRKTAPENGGSNAE